jgi:hypothetical protein
MYRSPHLFLDTPNAFLAYKLGHARQKTPTRKRERDGPGKKSGEMKYARGDVSELLK